MNSAMNSTLTTSPAAELVHLRESLLSSLQVLLDFTQQIDPQLYTKRVPSAMNSTIGGHLRHCLEHYKALREASELGLVDYDARKRDQALETQLSSAKACCEELISWAKSLNDQELGSAVKVRCKTSREGSESPAISSSLAREAMYSIHHAVHHQAIIGIMCQLLGTALPESFGLAPSTAAHRRNLATA